MRSSMQARVRTWLARRGAAVLAVTALALVSVPLSPGTAQAAVDQRVNLRVLVVSNGDPSVEAIATQLLREGVPFTKVDIGAAGRPAVDAAFLADGATSTGRFQAVVVPNHDGGGLSAAEVSALTAYERAYGVRQVSAYNWPGAAMGLSAPNYAGNLDGGTVTVTPAGLSGPFAYLDGSVPIDDFDPANGEVYAYLAQPLSPLPAGETFTPLLTASVGANSGVLAGVYAQGGQEELVLTAAFNPAMQWWNDVAHGVVTWMTRGIHLGHQRNYFAVQVDDVFLPDGRWSVAGNCTPGDDCVDPAVTTKDIRMTAADVSRLAAWQKANDFRLDMVFNGGGSTVWKEGAGLPATAPDPLLDAFLAAQAEFSWVNHTSTHPYLGCIQIAPTVVGGSWRCATAPTDTPRQDPEVAGALQAGTYWAAPEFLLAQIQQNQAWGAARFTDFDRTELVTGEHSGLAVLPQQPSDNPFLGPVLAQAGVAYTASDASREPNARSAGPATVTVPRHPMNIYYNAGTFSDQIDEYNWYYTSRANGGGGICEANPATSTCIAPLAAGSAAEARASFDSYLKPLEVRNALSRVLSNDPRPFYAHQSNLAEDGILYPVVQGVLDSYRAVHAANAPVVRTDLRSQSEVLTRMSSWKSAADGVSAYLDGSGVHVADAAAQVPVTVPAGTKVSGASLESYGGELSGWTSGTLTAVPTTPRGGYIGTSTVIAPDAPTMGTATAGNAAATLTWTAPVLDGGSPVTGYVVSVYEGDSATPARTVPVAGATAAQIAGLTNGTPYTFTVAAVNSVGTSPASGRSASVTPAAPATVPGAPVLGTAIAGNTTAAVTWTAPAADGGAAITGYRVSVFQGTGTAAVRTVDVAAPATTADVPGLANGTAYSLSVAAVNSVGTGPDSARSALVTPATVAGAPTITSVTPGNASATVAWTAPAETGGAPVTGYVVSVYQGTGTTAVRTVEAAATATSAQLTGLVNGTAYTVTVAARNTAGLGTASAASAVTPLAPMTVPGAPAITSVTAGNAAAALAWTAPVSTGGTPVTGYVVSVFEGTGTTAVRTVEAATTATTVTGLRNGTSYSFAVSARNAAGLGAASGRSGTVTPSTVPGVPAIGEATPGNASASVGWTMSTDTGGSALTGYVVRAYAGTASTPAVTLQVPASATRATVGGLVNGTGYTFTVAAVNANGAGAESGRSARVVPAAGAATPGAPTIGTATPGNGTATVNWTAPAEPGTSPVLGYAISAAGPAGTPAVRTVLAGWWATSATVSGLTNGVPYTFTVTALNWSGAGARSAPSNPVIPLAPAALPGAPRIGAATAGDGWVSVSWTAPRSTGGSPITGYLVSVSVGNMVVQQASAGAGDTRATVPGLRNGISYTVRVSAASAAGIGAASDRSNSVTPAVRPDAPTSVRATAGDRRLTVRWAEPADDGGSDITGYLVSVFTGSGSEPVRTVKASRNATSVTVSDLTNGKAYTVTVAAVNAAGAGDDSARSETVTAKK
ncbi:MAG: hypothetical protein JWQ99_1205 [Blastococcus sp.]|nr:hypothetical protein [Blastococcus sp.]